MYCKFMPFLVGLFIVVAAAGQEKKGAAIEEVPAPESLLKAEKSIKEIYKAEYAKKKTSDQVDLAKKLLAQSLETTDDSAARYVLLRESRDLAGKAGDIDLAMKAVDEMAKHFAIKRLDVKLGVLELAEKSASTIPIFNRIFDLSLGCIDEAIAADAYELAASFLKSAQTASGKTKSASQITLVTNRTREVETIRKEFEKVKMDLKKIEMKSDDADANLNAGKFLCFYKGNWTTGLPCLANSSDEKLKTFAKKDLDAPSEASARVELADAWWELGDGLDSVAQTELRLHAFSWYKQAIGDLKGLTKSRVEKRIADMEKIAATRVRTGPASNWVVLFRSSDPTLWNKNGAKKGKNDFAAPLSTAPDDMKYLKLTEMTKNRFVIIELAKDQLEKRVENGGYGWNGTNAFEWGGNYLGIYDLDMNKPSKGDVFLYSPGAFKAFRGWGFGPRYGENNKQGWTWAGEVLAAPMVFEISVKNTDLTPDESKHLLKKKAK